MTEIKLTITGGPQAGQVYEFEDGPVTLGRDAGTVDLAIDYAGVSRRHALIRTAGGRVTLEDLNSSNGTFVNEQPVTAPVILSHGDRIGLGRSIQLIIEIEEAVDQGIDRQQMTQIASRRSLPTAQGTDISYVTGAVPPELAITIAGETPKTYPLESALISIGRALDNDIVIPSQIVSRHHARLEWDDGGYLIVPDPNATNPLILNGHPVTTAQPLHHDDKLRIGGKDPGMMVTMTYQSPSEAAAELVTISFGTQNQLQIGRDPGNDVVLESPQVSRFHALAERVGQRFRIRDLQSSNGTFVNGARIEGEAWLDTDDEIIIGPYRFVMGEDGFDQYDESVGLRVEAINLNKWVRKDLNILQNISLIFQPREFIVVVGQSGGGKSTLIDSIAGYRPATHGKVLVNGTNVYENFDAIRHNIGFVPQKDIIHMELTVYQALEYAARLRMPPDTSKQERHERVMQVLEDLDLTHRKDVQISGLSGGQQKRVSIGVELLTQPGLFFLDEPTSGLDPGTETALMQLMRRLADQGRTIVLITHATKNVMLADKVVFLARGGYLAWFGPPEEALEYFDRYRDDYARRAGKMEFDEIYAVLDDQSKGSAADWAERYLNHPAYQQYIAGPLQQTELATESSKPVKEESKTEHKQVSGLRQFLILSGRNFKILTRDRFSLALMLAAAPIVGLLDVVLAVLMGREPFSHATGDITNVIITTFLLPVYAVMVGALAMMREIVKEGEIYKRERLVNLKLIPYVLSKIWIAALLALYQAAAYTIIRHLAFDIPGGPLEFGLIYVTMVMATFAGMMLGLFASAVAPNANSAPLLVILLILPQIVLGGALISAVPETVSSITSTKWGFEGIMAAVGVGSDVAADACWLIPEEQRAELTDDYKEVNCNCMGTSVFDPEQCNYPGIGQFYSDDLNQTPPQEPAPLREQPARPEFPPEPEQPADQSDSVAMAEYFEELETWRDQVEEIQGDYEADLQAYQREAAAYQEELIAYQTELARQQGARLAAVQPAEASIEHLVTNFPWTMVNKDDQAAFTAKMLKDWIAQAVISAILFVGILIFQKRKDVN